MAALYAFVTHPLLPSTSAARASPRRGRHEYYCSASRPVLSPSPPSEASVSGPVVHRYLWDTGPQFVMWYTARSGDAGNVGGAGSLSGDVRLALSSDGLQWRREHGPLPGGSILSANDEEWWSFDTAHVSAGSVLLNSPTRVRADAGIYLMYYTGGDREVVHGARGTRTRIGVAISKDGEHFTRIEGSDPSGAVLTGKHDDEFVGAPCVIFHNDCYTMFYQTVSVTTDRTVHFSVNAAVSTDGFRFTQREGRVFQTSARRPAALRRKDGTWAMFVEVVDMDDGTHRIAMAVSEDGDGKQWSEPQIVLRESRDEDAFDTDGVSHPCPVLQDDGVSLLLYYTGKNAGTSIGVARSDGADWTKLTRVCGESGETF